VFSHVSRFMSDLRAQLGVRGRRRSHGWFEGSCCNGHRAGCVGSENCRRACAFLVCAFLACAFLVCAIVLAQ
jgi:hypothetical protein